MQANNIIHKNNYNISISFKAGLTPKIMKDIQAVNPTEISQYLSNKEIVTNFQDNKIIAWCCAKVVEIISAPSLAQCIPSSKVEISAIASFFDL